MPSHASAASVLLVGGVLLAGCVEPHVITAASGLEIAATHLARESGSVRAPDSVTEVRLGHGLDLNGKVPPAFGASRFAVGDPIHLSMWEVTDAPAGSLVRVSVLDASERIVWSEEKQAPSGESYVSFDIGRGLVQGTYRADVIVGQEVRSHTGFEVFRWSERGTR